MMEATITSETSVKLLADCTAQHPRRQSSSYSPPWEPEISRFRHCSTVETVSLNNPRINQSMIIRRVKCIKTVGIVLQRDSLHWKEALCYSILMKFVPDSHVLYWARARQKTSPVLCAIVAMELVPPRGYRAPRRNLHCYSTISFRVAD
jgi:hypothetical protein